MCVYLPGCGSDAGVSAAAGGAGELPAGGGGPTQPACLSHPAGLTAAGKLTAICHIWVKYGHVFKVFFA